MPERSTDALGVLRRAFASVPMPPMVNADDVLVNANFGSNL